ncbi:MAG: hypothetical protein LQ340_005731 [Diploschistes diacapsis]|nr:MAG: hypothetical protein LQ340_005731 [Diploschistes diacapsis]
MSGAQAPASFDAFDTGTWSSLQLRQKILEKHHIANLPLVLYWVRQELIHIERKAIDRQDNDPDSRFSILKIDLTLHRHAFNKDYLAAVDHYVGEYSIYRFEQRLAPPPMGVTLAMYRRALLFDNLTEEMDISEISRGKEKDSAVRLSQYTTNHYTVYKHDIPKLFVVEGMLFQKFIDHFRSANRLTASQADAATTENSQTARCGRYNALTPNGQLEQLISCFKFVTFYERLGKRGNSARIAMRVADEMIEAVVALKLAGWSLAPDVVLDQIREDGEDDEVAVESIEDDQMEALRGELED